MRYVTGSNPQPNYDNKNYNHIKYLYSTFLWSYSRNCSVLPISRWINLTTESFVLIANQSACANCVVNDLIMFVLITLHVVTTI